MSGSTVAGNFSPEPKLVHTWRRRAVCLPTPIAFQFSGLENVEDGGLCSPADVVQQIQGVQKKTGSEFGFGRDQAQNGVFLKQIDGSVNKLGQATVDLEHGDRARVIVWLSRDEDLECLSLAFPKFQKFPQLPQGPS